MASNFITQLPGFSRLPFGWGAGKGSSSTESSPPPSFGGYRARKSISEPQRPRGRPRLVSEMSLSLINKGLLNPTGENNCFLNSAVQVCATFYVMVVVMLSPLFYLSSPSLPPSLSPLFYLSSPSLPSSLSISLLSLSSSLPLSSLLSLFSPSLPPSLSPLFYLSSLPLFLPLSSPLPLFLPLSSPSLLSLSPSLPLSSLLSLSSPSLPPSLPPSPPPSLSPRFSGTLMSFEGASERSKVTLVWARHAFSAPSR